MTKETKQMTSVAEVKDAITDYFDGNEDILENLRDMISEYTDANEATIKAAVYTITSTMFMTTQSDKDDERIELIIREVEMEMEVWDDTLT